MLHLASTQQTGKAVIKAAGLFVGTEAGWKRLYAQNPGHIASDSGSPG